MASGHHETNVLSFPMDESFNFLISPGAMLCTVSYPPLLALISFLNFKTLFCTLSLCAHPDNPVFSFPGGHLIKMQHKKISGNEVGYLYPNAYNGAHSLITEQRVSFKIRFFSL